MSSQELADTLAPRIVETTIKSFEGEKQTRGDYSWTVEAAKGKCRTDPLKEWVLFSLASFIHGCRTSTKDDKVFLNFERSFIATSAHHYVERGAFSSVAELSELARDRLSEYSAAMSGEDGESAMQSVARTFLLNAGCNPDDLVSRVGAVGSFVNGAVSAKELFDKLQKTVQLTD